MKYLQNIRFYLVLMTLFSLFLLIALYNSKQNEKVLDEKYEQLKFRTDSLDAMLFLHEIELNRYLITHEIFYEKNPSAAKQFTEIYSNETE